MAELDLQKQMAEAAAECGGIAAALLAIQKSLDKMEPTVTRMEPVLASLEPTVVDLAAWHPGVDQAVGRLQADLGEIRAELAKITASPFFHEAGKATSGGIPTTADVPSLTNNTGCDGHGPYGHSRTPPARVSVVGGSLLPSPAPANGGSDGVNPSRSSGDCYVESATVRGACLSHHAAPAGYTGDSSSCVLKQNSVDAQFWWRRSLQSRQCEVFFGSFVCR